MAYFMKFLVVAMLIALSSEVLSQVYQFPKDSADRNPFARSKVIKHEQELMILTDNITGSLNSNAVQHRIYNLSPIPTLIAGNPYYSSVNNEGNRHLHAAVGDFNNDDYQEVVTAWQTGTDIYITIPTIHPTTFAVNTGISSYTLTGPLAAGNGSDAGRIIIRTADFDSDGQSEFVTAYRNPLDGMIHIDVFNVDSASYQIQLSASIADESLSISGSNAFEAFDMVVRDLDFDGRDEIILAGRQVGGTTHNLFCKIYKVNGNGSVLSLQPKAKKFFDNSIPIYKNVYIKLATGDFNGDLLKEIAVSYNFQLDNYPSPNPDTYIKVLQPADSTATTPLQPDYLEVLIDNNFSYGINQNENFIYNFCMDAADIDGDGHDEIVVSYDGGACRVLKTEDNFNFVLMTNIGSSNSNTSSPIYDNFLSIADLNRDGLYDIINVRNSLDQNFNPFRQELNVTVHTWDTTTSSFVLLVAIDDLEPIDEANGSDRQFTIAVGDFDLDRVRFGNPKKFNYSQMKYPLVILNAPPVHFDTLGGGVVADVAGVFPSPPVNNDFKSQYSTLTSQGLTLATKENSDWAASAELQLKDSLNGYSIEANLTLKFGRKFSNTQSSIQTVTVSSLNTAYTDDLIYGWITDYLCYEYPIFVDDTLVGFITSLVPVNGQKTWFGGNDPLGYEVLLNHEPGNILSYPYYTQVAQDPALKQGIKADFGNTYSVGPTANFQWGMQFSDINTSITDTTTEAGVEASIKEGSLKQSLKLSGNYNFSKTSTISNTIQSDIKFDISMGPLAGGVADPHYRVNPYLIWSQDGSVTLNYSVLPETPSTGFPSSWWWQNYQLQDPALVLPWRLYPEKGFPLLDNSKRTLSKSISFSHKNPLPGDTVDIYVRVHNYSVSPTTGPVEVNFYLGDPNNGGIPITSTTGQTSVSTVVPLIKQGREEVKFTWVAPPGIVADPRIFAWLDAANTMTEVHESNNLGWIPLGINYPLTGINENEREIISGTIYPNPTTGTAIMPVLLNKVSDINFEIYNIMGMKVMEIPSQFYPAGEHYIHFQFESLTSGLYFCKMISKNGNSVTKFIINDER